MLRRLILALLMLPACLALEKFTINYNETGKVISYLDQYWVVQVNGTLTITNPFNYSYDYLTIPYNLGSLTIFELNGTDNIKPGAVSVFNLQPNTSITIRYVIRGISAYDPMTGKNGVFFSSVDMSELDLNSLLISRIYKAVIENQTVQNIGVKSVVGRRLVSVLLQNPGSSRQNVTSVTVIKTPDQDPNTELDTWHFGPFILNGFEVWEDDVLDYNASDGEVYWLSTEVATPIKDLDVINSHTIKLFDENDVFPVVNATLNESLWYRNITEYLEHLMYMKKTVSQKVMLPGDEIGIRIQLNNFAPVVRDFTLREEVPAGFSIAGNITGTAFNNGSIYWKSSVGGDSSVMIGYKLRFDDNNSFGLDFFEPAVLAYANETVYSPRIPFVRQEILDKKVFIQKNIRYGVNNELAVSIKIQNLGESKLENIFVVEFLGANDEFREISKAPISKGRWEIPLLEQGEVWEVTYVTSDTPDSVMLPEVYGLDKKIVLKTLVFEHTIRSGWLHEGMRKAQIIGPIVAVAILLSFFVYHRRTYAKKIAPFRQVKRVIDRLKDSTEPDNQAKIDLLKEESKSKDTVQVVEAWKGRPESSRADSPKKTAHENMDRLKKIEVETK